MGALGIPMHFLLRLPFATPLSGRLMLISFTGRKTGKSYHQLGSSVQHGDTWLTPVGGKWNLQDGKLVRVWLRGRDVVTRPELVKDPGEFERLLAVMMKANPRVNAFIGIPKGPDGRLERGHLESAVRHGFRIVWWYIGAEVQK